MKKITSKSTEVGGRTLTLETGRFAQQASSSVVAKYGETTVFCAVTTGREDTKKDYFPLTVDYQERLYAGGRIKGSRWVKREGRSTDAETLSGRLIDRSIRPLFPKEYKREVQVVVMVLSIDGENDADILGVIAASAAVALSGIPWAGPVAAVRMGMEEDKLIVNPVNGNRQGSKLDLVVTSGKKLVDMLEAGARQIPEKTVFEAIEAAVGENQKIIRLIEEMAEEAGTVKVNSSPASAPESLVTKIRSKAKKAIEEYISNAVASEGSSLEEIAGLMSEEADENEKPFIAPVLEQLLHETVRQNILTGDKRPDGRKLDEIRPLSTEVGVLPRVHGSAVFARGQTQALTITTLGAPSLSQSLESAEGEDTKRYMHHYYFPPFSTGETGRMGGPSRREIGHGALAERALSPVIPSENEFPYAIRVVSEIMSSNGSTSMASTCGSTLSLMDAGVPIVSPVAGISIGLVTPENYPDKSGGYKLLTDIIGMEDHHGDMDFKVAGTTAGITAIQLDVKVPGLTLQIIKETLDRAKVAREEILKVITKTIPTPRKELSKYAPKISTTQIPVEKIGELIGPGGKVIKQLMAQTETTIDVRDDGSVFVSGIDTQKVAEAITWISGLGKDAVVGEIYDGIVARIQPFGAFVNILPGKDGLVHVSQMTEGFVSDPRQVVSEGQQVKVWVTEIDSMGRINLSMIFDPEGKPAIKVQPPRETGHFDNRRRPPRR